MCRGACPSPPHPSLALYSPARPPTFLPFSYLPPLALRDSTSPPLQALQPPPAPTRGTRNVPSEPHPLETSAAAIIQRLEDTGLFFPVRSTEEGGALGRLATAAGFKAMNACCSGLARLLRLATWRDWAHPQPGTGSSGAQEAPLDWDEDWDSACRPVPLRALMDTLYDAAMVLCFWAPRPGKPLGGRWAGRRLGAPAVLMPARAAPSPWQPLCIALRLFSKLGPVAPAGSSRGTVLLLPCLACV